MAKNIWLIKSNAKNVRYKHRQKCTIEFKLFTIHQSIQ